MNAGSFAAAEPHHCSPRLITAVGLEPHPDLYDTATSTLECSGIAAGVLVDRQSLANLRLREGLAG